MVNLLDLAKPRRESSKKLAAYQKVFLGALLRKAGHPVFVATAASGNIENVACEHADDWSAAGMVRYRSRRDLLEILPETFGSEHHALKLASLDKTFAFPAASLVHIWWPAHCYGISNCSSCGRGAMHNCLMGERLTGCPSQIAY